MIQLLPIVVPALIELYSPTLQLATSNQQFPVPPLAAIHPHLIRDLEHSWGSLKLRHTAEQMLDEWREDVIVRDRLCAKVAKLDDCDANQADSKREVIAYIHGLDGHTADVTVQTIAVALWWRISL